MLATDPLSLVFLGCVVFSGAFLVGRFRAYTRVDETAHCVSAMTKLARQ